MTTGIIIVNYKTPWHLRECLNSIVKHTKDFHIILVHNGIDQESIKVTDKFKQKYPDLITIITNEKNLGLVGGVNSAYETGMKFERVCFLNSDIIVTKNWLDELNRCMDDDPEVVQVSPDSNQFHEEGLIWRLVKWQVMKRFPSLGAKLYKLQLYFNPPKDKNTGRGFQKIDNFFLFPGGYCNLVQTKFFKERGYFWDPNIIHGYWDDFDLAMYLRQYGKIGATMKSYVYHFLNASFDKVSEERQGLKNKLMLLNGLYVMDKWSKQIEAELKKLTPDEFAEWNNSYVVQMMLTYFGMTKVKPEMIDYIRSIPAKEIGKTFLK